MIENMPLLVLEDGNKRKFEIGFEFLHTHYPHLADGAVVFHQKVKKTVGPDGLIYVGQRESAVVGNEDQYVKILGSEDATTCHILVIRHDCGTTGIVHLDGVATKESIRDLIAEMKLLSNNSDIGYNVHIFGGFSDDRSLSLELSNEIISSLQACQEEIILHTACMTHKNNVVRNAIAFPIIYGVAIDVRTGEIDPATFPDKGPDVALRSARHYSSESALSIYKSGTGIIEILPFDYEPVAYAQMWLTAPDHVVLKYLSTSPQQEPADFVSNVRKTIEFTLATTREEVFKNDEPRRHKIMPGGTWELQ